MRERHRPATAGGIGRSQGDGPELCGRHHPADRYRRRRRPRTDDSRHRADGTARQDGCRVRVRWLRDQTTAPESTGGNAHRETASASGEVEAARRSARTVPPGETAAPVPRGGGSGRDHRPGGPLRRPDAAVGVRVRDSFRETGPVRHGGANSAARPTYVIMTVPPRAWTELPWITAETPGEATVSGLLE